MDSLVRRLLGLIIVLVCLVSLFYLYKEPTYDRIAEIISPPRDVLKLLTKKDLCEAIRRPLEALKWQESSRQDPIYALVVAAISAQMYKDQIYCKGFAPDLRLLQEDVKYYWVKAKTWAGDDPEKKDRIQEWRREFPQLAQNIDKVIDKVITPSTPPDVPIEIAKKQRKEEEEERKVEVDKTTAEEERRRIEEERRKMEEEKKRMEEERQKIEEERRKVAQDKRKVEEEKSKIDDKADGEKKDKVGPEMALIPAGEFWIGSNDGRENEKPRRRVYLDAFYIDTYEVTNSQYEKFIKATGYGAPDYWNDPTSNGSQQPVVAVSWHDADAYCKWARKRLPTEAEWEKAARGTDGRKYPWGNEEPDSGKANYYFWARIFFTRTTPVGSYPTGVSIYGVHDMAGNVWEWVADWYSESYYREASQRNPKGPGSGLHRVFRGGAWLIPFYTDLRSSYREGKDPTYRHWHLGFRCAR